MNHKIFNNKYKKYKKHYNYKKIKKANFYYKFPSARKKKLLNNYKNFTWSYFLYGIICGIIITIISIMLLTNIVNKKSKVKHNNSHFINSTVKKQAINSSPNSSFIAATNRHNNNNNNNNYEFYNLLTSSKKKNQDHQNPAKYILEVGTFNKISDADELKAKLALLGFESKIQIINSKNQLKSFKVNVGPFDSQTTTIFQKNKLSKYGIQNVLMKNV